MMCEWRRLDILCDGREIWNVIININPFLHVQMFTVLSKWRAIFKYLEHKNVWNDDTNY